MPEADPEELFAALEVEAHAALDRPWASAPPVALRPLLTVGVFPAFGAHRAWCVFDSTAGALLVRELAWDRVSDLAAFAEQFPGRERPRPSHPTLAIRDATVPRATFEDLLLAAESLALPDAVTWIPSSGLFTNIRFDSRPGAPAFRWGLEMPAGWEALDAWAEKAWQALEATFARGPA